MKFELNRWYSFPLVAFLWVATSAFGGCDGESSTGGDTNITGDNNIVCINNSVAGEDVKSPTIDCHREGMGGIPDEPEEPGES